jgi:hypothetical protein
VLSCEGVSSAFQMTVVFLSTTLFKTAARFQFRSETREIEATNFLLLSEKIGVFSLVSHRSETGKV